MARITKRNVTVTTIVTTINDLIDIPGVTTNDIDNILKNNSTTSDSDKFAGQYRSYYDCGGSCSWTASGR